MKEKTTYTNANNSKSKGFSLIELIVTIAIVTTLIGLLVPQFIRYISAKRGTACEENREAILDVCEKVVYGRAVPLTALDGVTLNATSIEALPSTISATDKETLKAHSVCPEHGTMSLRVVDGIIYCECNVHDGSGDEGFAHTGTVAADMTTWTGSGSITIDPSFSITTHSGVGPIDPPDPPEETPPSEDPPEDTYASSYWPYPEDPRWNEMDSSGDAYIEIEVPSGLFPPRTASMNGMYFCAINRTGTVPKGKLKVYKSKAGDPMYYLAGSESESIVVTNGLSYNQETIIKAAEENSSIWVDMGAQDKKVDRNDQFWISPGTIYTCANGRRYIFFHQGQEQTSLPAEDFTGNDFGNWYYVGDSDPLR